MRFDETDLELFRHIADAGSITHGAARANLALTAASARVRTMEERLGVVLLDRKRHGVVLTPAGRALLSHAQGLLAQADRMREELSLFQGGLAGHVRVFANTNAFSSYLPTALGPFLIKHPHIDIRIAERPSEAIIGLVADGTADIGIVAAETDLGGLTAKPVAMDRYVVITPVGHALAQAEKVSFSQTLGSDFVAGPSHGLFASKAQRLGRLIRVRIRMRDDMQVCQLVSAGVGVGIVPLSIVTSAGRYWPLSQISLTDGWAIRRIFACVKDKTALSRSAQLLFEHLTDTTDAHVAEIANNAERPNRGEPTSPTASTSPAAVSASRISPRN
jgi:molybdate transport repressor ModE-like protein